nr:EOG090X06BA [Eulimnadia texana]
MKLCLKIQLQDLLEKININDATGLKELLKEQNLKPDVEDDNGMTLLQHAAFKGNYEMSQILLDLGANPNGGHHEHQYTTLHFAALSGNAELCELLLSHGVKVDAINSVNRTAAQMAAFVGNHQCVSVINNYIPREEIDYFTQPQGLDKEGKFPAHSAPSLHRLLMQANLHPVRILLTVQKFPLLWENLKNASEVLEQLSERFMKRGQEANELLSLKCHHLAFTLKALEREQSKKKESKSSEIIETFIKLFLKPRKDGFPEFLDNFVRESIRSFAFKDTVVFRQLVVGLAKTKQSPESTLAIQMLNSAVNGQRGFAEEQVCGTCGQEKAPKKCSKCKMVQYCDKECQRLHWPLHKKECDSLAEHFQKMQIKQEENKTETA